MTETNNSTQTGGNFLNFALFVCIIVCLSNTESDVFKRLDADLYYQLLVALIVIQSLLLVFLCCGFIYAVSESKPFCLMMLTNLLIISSLITFYYFMFSIWIHDPNHTLFFYKNFWDEWSFTKHQLHKCGVQDSDHWAYYMTEVIIRIYSTSGFILSLVLPCLCCGVIVAHRVNQQDNDFLTPNSDLSARL